MTLNEKLSFNLRNLLPEAYYPNSCNIKITETKKAVSKAEEMKRLLGDKKQKKAVPVNSGDNDGDAKMQQQSIETAKDDSSVTVIESRIVVNVLPQTEFFLLLKRMDAKRGFSMTVETDSFVRKKRR